MTAGTTGHPYVRPLARLAGDLPAPPSDPPEHRSPARGRLQSPARRWVVALILIGTLWGCLYGAREGGFTGRLTPFGEEPEIALHLARGHGYRSPFNRAAAAPLTSWSPPIYPGLMAAAYRAFGPDNHAAVGAMVVLNAICFGLTAAALYAIGAWLVNRATGAIAATLLLLNPIFIGRVVYFWDAYLALAIFTWIIAWAIWLGAHQAHRHRILAFTSLGGALGLLALTNSAYVLSFPVIFWIAVRRQLLRPRTALTAALGCAAGFAMVLTPWTIRNYSAFHRLFFVRAGVPVELWIGNQPDSSGITEDVVDVQPFLCKRERTEVLTRGETAYFEDCARRFADERRQRPGHFNALCAQRAAYLFFGDPFRPLDYPLIPRWHVGRWYVAALAFHALAAISALAGAYAAWRLGHRRILWLLILGALSVVPYVVTHVDVRYALPLKALLLVPSGALVAAVATRLRSRGQVQASPRPAIV